MFDISFLLFFWLALNLLAFYNWVIPYLVACAITIPSSFVVFPFVFLFYQVIGNDNDAYHIWQNIFFIIMFYATLPILGLPYIIISKLSNDGLLLLLTSEQNEPRLKKQTN